MEKLPSSIERGSVSYEKNPLVKTTREIFKKAKEVLQAAAGGLKFAGTVLLAFGIFEKAAASSDVTTLQQGLNKIQTGESALGMTVSNLYAENKKGMDIDSFATLEVDHSYSGGKYTGGIKTAGPEIESGIEGDTVRIGDVEAKNLSVMGESNTQTDGKVTTTERGKFLSAFKVSPGDTAAQVSHEKSVASFGRTQKEAVLAALAAASSQESSTVTSVSGLNNENTSQGVEASSNNNFTSLSVLKGDNVIKNAWVVLQKVPEEKGGGYSAEILY